VQLDRNRDVEKFVSALRSAFSMSEQAAAEDPSQADERPTLADRAFVTLGVADHLTIKAEDRVQEGKATFV